MGREQTNSSGCPEEGHLQLWGLNAACALKMGMFFRIPVV